MITFDYKPYFAIIGDIVRSKKSQDRKSVQDKLKMILDEINETYLHGISSKFSITLGDEFQGLLHSGFCITDIIEKIEQEMYPVKIRFGVGVGEVSTEINLNSPFEMDGSAYYNARRMIDKCKKNEEKKMVSESNIWIGIENHNDVEELLNALFALNTVLKSKWTKSQREKIYIYTKQKRTQSDVAQILGINQSNVQKALKAAGFYTYQQSLRSVTNTFSQIMENEDV